MSELGMGVTAKILFDKPSDCMAVVSGKEIANVEIDTEYNDRKRDRLRFDFVGGGVLNLWDSGQSCCECRYMTTDDDLAYHVGATLVGYEVRNAPNVKGQYESDVHEVQFLVVKTSKGQFTVETHNEHNGWYGGFYIDAEYTGPEEDLPEDCRV